MHASPGRSVGLAIVAALVVAASAAAGSSPVPAAGTETTTVKPAVGPPGEKILVVGTGFAPKERIRISFDKQPITKARADSKGDFQASTRVPTDVGFGQHTVTSVGVKTKLPSFAMYFVRTDWPQVGFDAAHTHFNTFEHQLGAANVSSLTEAWIGRTSYFADTVSPVVADGLVAVQSSDGYLYAFPDQCGEALTECSRLWRAAFAGPLFASPAVLGNDVLGVSGGQLEFVPMSCADPCTGFGGFAAAIGDLTAPTVDGSTVVVGADDFEVHALTCDTAGCSRLWHGVTTGRSVGQPAIAGGLVFAPSSDGKLYVYPERCGTGVDPLCQPLWTSATPGDLSDSAPAVAGGMVFVGSADHHLYAFRTTCGATTCTPRWTATTVGSVGSPAVANGRVFVESYGGQLYAFPTSCSGACAPSWSAMVASPSSHYHPAPAVANGVVYAGGNGIYAFSAAGCGASTCSPLWSRTDIGNVGPPAIANGGVYAGAGTSVMSFDIPPSSE